MFERISLASSSFKWRWVRDLRSPGCPPGQRSVWVCRRGVYGRHQPERGHLGQSDHSETWIYPSFFVRFLFVIVKLVVLIVDYTVGDHFQNLAGTLKGWARGAILHPMETQVYSTWLEIDLDAIRNNVRAVMRRTNTNVMAVIKANGYGHGALQVARAVTEAGATWCGVARMEEALTLREQGVTSELMVLGYTPPA